MATTPSAQTGLALPASLSAEEAQRILDDAAAQKSAPQTLSARKRRRVRSAMPHEESPPPDGDGSSQEEVFNDEVGFTSVHWKQLSHVSRVHWARWFGFRNEESVNIVLKKAMGDEICSPENTYAYDLGFEKVRTWSRQWQYEVLKGIVRNVSTIHTSK